MHTGGEGDVEASNTEQLQGAVRDAGPLARTLRNMPGPFVVKQSKPAQWVSTADAYMGDHSDQVEHAGGFSRGPFVIKQGGMRGNLDAVWEVEEVRELQPVLRVLPQPRTPCMA